MLVIKARDFGDADAPTTDGLREAYDWSAAATRP